MNVLEQRLYMAGLALRATVRELAGLLRSLLDQSGEARERSSQTVRAFVDGIRGD